MGMFDSYFAPWGDSLYEAQTKEFDSSLCSWILGSSIPLDDAVDSAARADRFWSLIEGFSIGDSWRVPAMGRSAALAHWDGVFCDVFCALDDQEARLSCQAGRALWEDPQWRSEGLARLHEASRERERSLAKTQNAHARLGRAWMSWKAEQERLRLNAPAPKMGGFGALVSSEHLNFKEKSLEEIWDQLLRSRPTDTPPFSWLRSSLAPATIAPEAPESLIEALANSGWGTEPPQERYLIALDPATLPERCEALMIQALREARLDRACIVANARPDVLTDPATRAETLLWLDRAIRSRLFCHDAVKLMIASNLYPQMALPDGSAISAPDWALSRTGVGSGAAEALIHAKAPLGIESLAALTMPDYHSLLPQALRSLQLAPDEPRDSRGFTLLALAAERACFLAVQTLLDIGADPAQSQPDQRPLLDAALHASSAAQGNSQKDFERVAWALIRHGAPLPEGAALTPWLASAYAEREAQLIQTVSAPAKTAGPRKGI